jgi:hypothetical protein
MRHRAITTRWMSTANRWTYRRPSTGKIAGKVINHFGDEVMKVFRV